MAHLFENADVLALDKPPGVSMATSSRADKSAAAAVERLLLACKEAADPAVAPGASAGSPDLGGGRPGEVRRRTPRPLPGLSDGRRAQDLPRAGLGASRSRRAGSCEDPLGRDPRTDARRSRAVRRQARGHAATGRCARLHGVADLELSPETGRTHQIRVHASTHGHPIVGDDLYGGATRWHGVRDAATRRALAAVARPLLHAERLEIPALGIDVAAPLPEDYAG